MTELPKIAAKELQNTRPIPVRLRFKIDLLKTAYGAPAVERDFREWCREHKAEVFKWPIIEYLKVVDSRLGPETEEARANLDDPRILELTTYAYRQTGILAPKRRIAELLTVYTLDEVKLALDEYLESQGNVDLKLPMKTFFSDNGAEAVILARRERDRMGLKNE